MQSGLAHSKHNGWMNMVKTNWVSALVLFGAVLLASACADQQAPTDQVGDGFEIQRRDATGFEATVTSAGASLHFVVTESAPDVIDVSYDFGDPVIGFRLDYRAGQGEFQPSGTPLDAAQMRLIDTLLAELAAMPDLMAAKTRVDEAAFRQTNFMQIVPTGEPLVNHVFAAQQGWIHISCSCFNQYLGGSDYRICGRGTSCTGGSGNGCKGRCGTACSPCAGTTAYTRDCGRHDWGIGSFAAASDDFSFAPNNCSC
jgi:hypothetical protein